MYIVNQKRNRIFNIDQFQQIFVMDNAIQCKWGSEVCVLGVYRDEERAEQVFRDYIWCDIGVNHKIEMPEA